MEFVFLLILLITMGVALASGYPVAFALPGSAILSIGLAALCGYIFSGNVDAYFLQGGPSQWLDAGVMNFRGVYWEVERDTLIAIPLFVFMGIMLERSKVAEDLLVTMAQLFGPIPGGLGIAVVLVGALLAAPTGIVGATVVAMGLISLPVMLRAKYSTSLATGTISASGTLGQIIPPSIVLIILADQLSSATNQASTIRQADYKQATGQFSMPSEFGLTSTSAGDMFLGALLPGLVLVALYMAYILILALIRPQAAPPVRFDDKLDLQFLGKVALALIPPLTLIFVVLGSIIMGVATVNQAGAIGAIGAAIMAGYRLQEGRTGAFRPALLAIVSIFAIIVLLGHYDINIKNTRTDSEWTGVALASLAVAGLLLSVFWSLWRIYKINDTLTGVMIETAKTTSLVFIILLGAAMLTAAFRAFGGEDLVRDFLTGLPGGFITKFIVVMSVIFILGFFLDFIEIAVVVVPIIAPILLADTTANITAVWLGVMIGVNMQTSFLTPPFGFALFYLRGIAPPSVKTLQMYAGVVPFIILQLGGLAIVGLWPTLVNYLPNRVYLTSETAPPPKNPRLSLCIEDMLFKQYDAQGKLLRDAIANARALDLSFLPDHQKNKLLHGFKNATETFERVSNVRKASAMLHAFTPTYKPIHVAARKTQATIRNIKQRISEQEDALSRLIRDNGEGERAIKVLRGKIKVLKDESAALRATLPENWKALRERYLHLANSEKRARNIYRRTVDEAYEPVSNILVLLSQVESLAAIGDQLKSLNVVIKEKPATEAAKTIREAESLFNGIAGSSHIKSRFSKARRNIGRRNPKLQRAAQSISEGLKRYEQELLWRKRAKKKLYSGLSVYEVAIRDTIGLRSQPRVNSEHASELASCLSVHRDISLNF
ncbi:MAG: TRAP transporter large permease subunit [Pseudomonadota bacterium]|nr:TRAP transporter large permease subunit [Pseudomonadota bacterium]